MEFQEKCIEMETILADKYSFNNTPAFTRQMTDTLKLMDHLIDYGWEFEIWYSGTNITVIVSDDEGNIYEQCGRSLPYVICKAIIKNRNKGV